MVGVIFVRYNLRMTNGSRMGSVFAKFGVANLRSRIKLDVPGRHRRQSAAVKFTGTTEVPVSELSISLETGGDLTVLVDGESINAPSRKFLFFREPKNRQCSIFRAYQGQNIIYLDQLFHAAKKGKFAERVYNGYYSGKNKSRESRTGLVFPQNKTI